MWCRWINTEFHKLNLVGSNLRDFRLLAQDQAWLDQMVLEQRTRAEWIRNVQNQLHEDNQNQEVVSLHRYYDDIRSRFGNRDAGSGGAGAGAGVGGSGPQGLAAVKAEVDAAASMRAKKQAAAARAPNPEKPGSSSSGE